MNKINHKCNNCGCKIVAVNSTLYGKHFECIRHLNRPNACSGANISGELGRDLKELIYVSDKT